MPWRDSLSVPELRPWLSHLALIDLETEQRFRVRLSGAGLIRRLGREATGLSVDELADDIRRQLRAILNTATKGPAVASSAVPLGRATDWYCDVALPLAAATGAVSTILFASYPQRQT